MPLQRFKTVKPFLIAAFLIFSCPFIFFPLTDGDIVNWSQHSATLLREGGWLSGANDQSHGPLMVWTGAVFLKLFGGVLLWSELF